MVQHRHFAIGRDYQVAKNGAKMPTTMARDDSEKGFCPLFDSVLKADDRRSGYETPVQRTRAIESITDNAQDRSFPPSEVAFEERPKKSLLVR